MPTRLPNKSKVKAIRVDEVRRVETRARVTPATGNVDWLLLWSLSIGFCSVVLAALAFFAGGDPVGASAILFGAACIIALVLRGSAAPGDQD